MDATMSSSSSAFALKFNGAAHAGWLTRVVQIVVPLLFLAGAVLLVHSFGELDWSEIRRALRGYGAGAIAWGLTLSAAAYVCAGGYDLLAKRYEHHRLGDAQVFGIGAVSMAMTMNLGALLGGFGVRYRLYARHGLRPAQIARIIALVLLTNWSGFVLLGGLLFTLRPPQLPSDWGVPESVLVALGGLLLTCTAGYFALCAWRRGQRWTLRGISLRQPPMSFALGQLALSCGNWMCMAAVVACFMPERVAYVDTLAVLLVSSLAGLIARVPAGLGVTELIFAALLGGSGSSNAVVAALLAYRVCYYLVPLLFALAGYATLELRARRRAAQLSSS